MSRVPMTSDLLETERKLGHEGCAENKWGACAVAQAILADVMFWRERYDAVVKLAYELETELAALKASPRADAPRES